MMKISIKAIWNKVNLIQILKSFLLILLFVSIILCLCYLFYLGEYFFLFIIHSLLNIIFNLLLLVGFPLQNFNYTWTVALIVSLDFHHYILRRAVLSLIFPMGGILKYYIIYSTFIGITNKLKLDLVYLKKNIVFIHQDVNKYGEVKKIIHGLKIFQMALQRNKAMGKSFEVKKKECQLEEYMLNVITEYKNIKCIFELGKKFTNANNDNLTKGFSLHLQGSEEFSPEFESKQSYEADRINISEDNNIAIYDAFNSNCDILLTNATYYLNLDYKTLLFKFQYTNIFHNLYQRLFLQFKFHHVKTVKINDNFECLLITPKSADNNETLVIFSNQNAVDIESYAVSTENINFYLNFKNVSILIWNFRGYGTRSGYPSFSNVKKESEAIIDYLTTCKEMKFTKFILHGTSLGGFAACQMAKLCSRYQKNNVLLIADRTFSSINNVVKLFPYGFYLEKLYGLLFPLWYDDSSSCVESYLQAGKKIILYDENDEMICEKANLNTGISQLLYHRVIIPQVMKCLNMTSTRSPSDRLSTILFTQTQIEELEKAIAKLKAIPELHKKLMCYEYIITKLSSFPLNFESTLESFLFKMFIYGYPFNVDCELLPIDHSFSMIFIYQECFMFLQKLYIETLERKGEFSDHTDEYFILLNFIQSVRNAYRQCFIKDSGKIDFEIEKENVSYEDYEIKEEIKSELIEKIGFVKKITCGHNGALKEQEKKFLEMFLRAMGFV